MRIPKLVSMGWISVLAVLLISCGGGGGSASGNGGSSTPSNLQLGSLGASSAQSLTPVTISISGSNGDPITVSYSNSAGFSASGDVLSQSASSVTVVVPIYVDPVTHAPGAGTVSVTLMQDSTTTSAGTLSITALPSAASYGMSRGQITHAFLIYEQMLLARQLNDMQTVQQAIPSGTVNPSRSISTLYYSLIPAANQTRNDVDQAANLNNTFPWTTVSGTTLQMDASQVDMMDSILGALLVQEFSTSTAVQRYFTGRVERAVGHGSPTPRAENTLQQITQFISLNNSINDLTDEIRKAPGSFYNAAQAGMTGLKMYFDGSGDETSSGFVGTVSSATSFGVAVSTQLQLLLPTASCLASTTCTSSYADDIANQEQNAGLEAAKAEASLISSISALAGFTNEVGNLGSESFQAAVTTYQKATGGDLADLSDTSAGAAANLAPVIPNLGVVDGSMTVSNGIGSAASLTAVQLQNCAGGCGSFNITTMADQGGSYDLVIPLDISGVNYSSMTVVGYDFATNTGLTSETVNLSGLNTNAPVQVPAMSATCNDTDYGSPDADDPDCD